ncbi:MAG: metal ABC transporter ATP-binding protein [Wujia sp.]
MAILTGKDLSLGYEGKVLIQNLDFQVEKGDYLCIMGENGIGKTTLIKTVLGLIKPIKGEVIYGDGLKNNEIGYLPQHTIVQRDFPASVQEIVLSGCQGLRGSRPFYSKEEKQLAKMNMEKMDISNLAKRCYRELSGGQQQRVLLARALCATQKVLLLDEPVAGLDPGAMSNMYRLIRRLNEEGVTIIMISHDIAVAVGDASHVLHVGKKSFFGTKDAYMNSAIGRKFVSMQDMEGE